MGAALRTGRRLAQGVGLTDEAPKFVRVFRAAATVLAVLRVVLAGIILIIAAIESAKQRDELQE